ncbi:MAG TPA: AAA family ATPase [Ktedonobacterales bacterium]|nr:AAA family ATPase [Ktedonobacterales bacterium]
MEQKTLEMLRAVEDIAHLLKATFVAKDEFVELLITCAIAQEHLLIVGPPGTGKSDLIKRFALYSSSEQRSSNGHRISYFEYLLTRFTEPNEIFGPVNISAFREGKGAQRNTQGMLPRAEVAFLDEVFKANSAILNALLTILNERVFYNGSQREEVPLICAIGATNTVPDDTELSALYDRFLLRFWTDNVEESLFPELFQRGWKLEHDRMEQGYGLALTNIITTDELRQLHRELRWVDVSPVAQEYREVIRRIRAEGIRISDRRVVKFLKLIATSALRHKRDQANPGDFWVLRHVWNEPEQISHLQTILNPYIEAHQGDTWSAERTLNDIQNHVDLLSVQQKRLRTDTDYIDFLQQAEGLRRELLRHSAHSDKASADDQARCKMLLENLGALIDGLMQMLGPAL